MAANFEEHPCSGDLEQRRHYIEVKDPKDCTLMISEIWRSWQHTHSPKGVS